MTSKTASYQYDNLGRLTSVEFPDGASATYSYDSAGNRLTLVEVPSLSPPPPSTISGFSKGASGDFINNAMLIKLSSEAIVGWGDNTTGVLANGNAIASNSPAQAVVFDPNTTIPPVGATIVDWTFTNANLYVVYSNGWVYSAGKNAYGQLGHGDTTARPFLKRIEYFVTNGKTVTGVWAAGGRSTTDGGGCVYFQTSDFVMYGCGNNGAGNIGAGGTTNQNTPVACGGIPSTAANHVINVTISCPATTFSTYMLVSDAVGSTHGTVYVAGANSQGQLAQNTTTSVTGGFVQAMKTGSVVLTNVASISANAGWDGTTPVANAIALDTSGIAWVCGYNGHGELGFGTTQQKLFAQLNGTGGNAPSLTGVTLTEARLGLGIDGAGYGIDNAGIFYTWGYNGTYALMKNNNTSPSAPSAPSLPGIVSKVFFARGNYLLSNSQIFVLLTNGRLIYGGVDNGQLGINSVLTPNAFSYVSLPKVILDGTENIVDVFVHGSSTTQRVFMLTDAGNLYAAGSNTDSICTGGIASDVAAASVASVRLTNVPLAG